MGLHKRKGMENLHFHRNRYDYRTQRYKNADALHAFKSRGFGGEIGLEIGLQNNGGVNFIDCV